MRNKNGCKAEALIRTNVAVFQIAGYETYLVMFEGKLLDNLNFWFKKTLKGMQVTIATYPVNITCLEAGCTRQCSR